MFMECAARIKAKANGCSHRELLRSLTELLPYIQDFWGWKGSELLMSNDYGQGIELHNVGTRVQISKEIPDLSSNSASF